MMTDILGAPTRPGPEADLVLEFVQHVLPKPRDRESSLVFIEPQLERSKPDIVVVYWDPTISVKWPRSRRRLKTIDFRLAQLLNMEGPLVREELRAVFPRDLLPASLARLERAGIIKPNGRFWQLNDLSEIFAIHHIITYEAKISSTSKALEQAHLNTWFASESHIVTTIKQPSDRILRRAQMQGIGVWVIHNGGPPKRILEAKEHDVPRSYGSWLFNELVWATTTAGGD